MIRALRYRPGRDAPEELAPADVPAARAEGDGLVLVDVDQPDVETVEQLAQLVPLHPLVREDLVSANQRTKLERMHDHWHVAVHACRASDHTLVAQEIDVVFGAGWILLVRQAASDGTAPFALEPVTRRMELARDATGEIHVGMALWALLDVVVDGYFDVTDRFDERLDGIEEIVFSQERRDDIPQDVFELRRAMVRFRHLSAPLREVLGAIVRREVDCIADEGIVAFQDVFDHSLRVADLLETQRELLTGLLEAHLAVVSNRMNQVMKVTSSWGAIILGSTLIAGIYGMNFRHIPELLWGYGYWYALGLMVALTLVLYRSFKKRGWL